MLDKRTRGLLWLAFVAISNAGMIVYLQTYTKIGQGQYLFGLPESFTVLVLFVFGVTGVNVLFAWYYLGKPDVTEVYTPDREVEPEVESTIKGTQHTEER